MHLANQKLIIGYVGSNGRNAVAKLENWREMGEEHVFRVDVEGQQDGEKVAKEPATQYLFQGNWL